MTRAIRNVCADGAAPKAAGANKSAAAQTTTRRTR
jgi:hypothetical protein